MTRIAAEGGRHPGCRGGEWMQENQIVHLRTRGGSPMTMYRTADRPEARWIAQAAGLHERLGERLEPLWGRMPWAIAAAVAIGALWGVGAGSWMPRGPLTPGEAMWSMIVSLLVGGLAGLVSRSRWAMLAAPVAFAPCSNSCGSTSTGRRWTPRSSACTACWHWRSGRGLHALLSLVPMALGAALGAARRSVDHRGVDVDPSTRRTAAVIARRVGAGLVAVALLAFSAVLRSPRRAPTRSATRTATSSRAASRS